LSGVAILEPCHGITQLPGATPSDILSLYRARKISRSQGIGRPHLDMRSICARGRAQATVDKTDERWQA
jgi:hypothetical protein